MSQLYDIYKGDTFLLARTIVIKFDLVAEAINKELGYRGYTVAPDNPASYKYYLNLAGEYHQADHDYLKHTTGFDHIMVEVAIDTGYRQVPFVKELFYGPDSDISLLNEYQIGSTFYKELIRKYPLFESLIKGILNPLDINECIAAPNGSILSIAHRHRHVGENGEAYYELKDNLLKTKTIGLIETQEYNLINQLQLWVSKTLFRWVVGSYSYSDDLYAAYTLGILVAHIPSQILNIRWQNVHTPYAHTFHIKEYLNSHGKLGKHVPFIPLEQTLYLYRNVRYLELNMGKTQTFDELIKNMLTPTGVPLAGYYFKHDLSDMSDEDGILLPEARMMREHLNFKSIGSGDDRREIRELLERQEPLARENYKYIDERERETREAIRWSGDDELMVKVLESELTEIADPVPVTLISQLVWFWAWGSSNGFYKGSVFVNNPISGQRIALTPLNAFILMLYCTNIGEQRNTLEFIPNKKIPVRWITKTNNPQFIPKGYGAKPTLEEFKSQIESKYLYDTTINKIIGNFDGKYKASSPDEFFNMVKEHHVELSRKYFEVCRVEDLHGRGYAEHIFKHMYWHDVPVQLRTTKEPYTDWLNKLGIDFSYFTPNDYQTLAIDITNTCTGIDSNYSFSRSDLQKAMIDILKHFTSYTTHYLYSINERDITNSSGKYLRMTDLEVDGNASLMGGVYVGLDMFNDGANATSTTSLDFAPLNVTGAGLDKTDIRVDLINSLPDIINYRAELSTQMPMHHFSLLKASLSYDVIQRFDIPVPPGRIDYYDWIQRSTSSYVNFKTKGTSVKGVVFNSLVQDYPDVLDKIQANGVLNITGTLEHSTTAKFHEDYNDLLSPSMNKIDGMLTRIVNEANQKLVDGLFVTVSNEIDGSIVRYNATTFVDSVKTKVTVNSMVVELPIVNLIDGVGTKVTLGTAINDYPIYADNVITSVTAKAAIGDTDIIRDSIASTVTGIMEIRERNYNVDSTITSITVKGSITEDPRVADNSYMTESNVTGFVIEHPMVVDGIYSNLTATAEVIELTKLTDIHGLKDITVKARSSELPFSLDGIYPSISLEEAVVQDISDFDYRDDIKVTSARVNGHVVDMFISNYKDTNVVTTVTLTGSSTEGFDSNYKDNVKVTVDASILVVDRFKQNYTDNINSTVTITGLVVDKYVDSYIDSTTTTITVKGNTIDRFASRYVDKIIIKATATGVITDDFLP